MYNHDVMYVTPNTFISFKLMRILIGSRLLSVCSINNNSYSVKSDTVSKGRGLWFDRVLLNILSGCKSFTADSIMSHKALYLSCLEKSYHLHQRLMQRHFLTQGLQATVERCGYVCKRSVFVDLNTGKESNLHWFFMENVFWKANMPL